MPQNPILALFTQNAFTKAFQVALGGNQGDQYVSSLHGTKYTQSYSSNLFHGGNSAGVTTTVGEALTYVGCILSNPSTNTNNLIVRRVSGGLIVDPAAITQIYLWGGWKSAGVTVHTTPLTTYASKLGSTASSTAKLDSAATVPGATGPHIIQFLSISAATAATGSSFSIDLEGGIVIEPGGYVATGTNIAGPSSGFMAAFEWEEDPI